ncbi:MAG: cupin domain-containing protein [Defluviitaleaceae bacterium]|nr:cupin domain-containing protein [Defluviitaleaceae bacterium]
MIKKKEELCVAVNEKMRGGEGSVIIEHLLDKDGLCQKGRLYARVVLKPGCSIGYHTHEGETETYYIMKGTASYNDNGAETTLTVGDVAYTPDGCGHGVKNGGTVDLEMIALIILI